MDKIECIKNGINMYAEQFTEDEIMQINLILMKVLLRVDDEYSDV